MKCGATMLLWIAGSLVAALTTNANTDGANSYGHIAVRNVFNLKSPATLDTLKPTPTPPPTIELRGISTILGRMALFKVKAAKPGETDRSYILSEGQRKDDIEVLAIDEKNGSVTFDNHGTRQTLTTVKNASKPAMAFPPPAVATFKQAKKTELTHEEQTVLIEVDRELHKDEIAAGNYPPLPPTELSPADAVGMPPPVPQ